MNEIWNNNIKLLASEQMSIFVQFLKENHWAYDKNNENNLFLHKSAKKIIQIHSRYNPKQEAELFARKVEKFKDVILLGLGYGFPAQAILDVLPCDGKLIAVVMNNNLFYHSLKTIDLKSLLSDKRLELIICQSADVLLAQLSKIFNFNRNKDGAVVVWRPELKTLDKRYDKIIQIIDLYLIKKRSHEFYLKLNCSNIAQTYKEFIKIIGISEFQNRFKGYTAVIVSAGPSLENSLSDLVQNKSKLAIIATGTVVRALLMKNIIPDIVVVTDAKPDTYLQLKDLPEDVPVVVLPVTSSLVILKNLSPKIGAYIKHDPLYNSLSECSPKGFLESGGSVATVACSAAKMMGFNPIVLIGQDLSLDDKCKVYAFNDLECNLMQKNQMRLIEGIDGNDKITLDNFYAFLYWFEEFAHNNPGLRLINCTKSGAKIPGFEHCELSEFLSSTTAATIKRPLILDNELKLKEFDLAVENRCTKVLKGYGVLAE